MAVTPISNLHIEDESPDFVGEVQLAVGHLLGNKEGVAVARAFSAHNFSVTVKKVGPENGAHVPKKFKDSLGPLLTAGNIRKNAQP